MAEPNDINIRNGLLRQLESEKLNLYFDTLGVPTVGVGFALVVRPNQYNGNRWSMDPDSVNKFSEVMGHNPQEKAQFRQLVSHMADIKQQYRHQEEIRRPGAFSRSPMGQALQQVTGRMDDRWNILTPDTNGPMSITLTTEQSNNLLSYAADKRENTLNTLLSRGNCPAEALSDKQRAALLAMVYHGTAPQVRNIATQIGKYYRGEINATQLNSQIDSLGANPRFAGRAAQQINYLKDLGPRLRQQRSEAEPFNASPEAIRIVDALHEKLQANVGKQIEAAGAGRFADSMVAECTYQCIKKGITADNINHMFVDTNQNRIFIDTKLDGKIAVIDAFEAAKVIQPNAYRLPHKLRKRRFNSRYRNRICNWRSRNEADQN